MTVRVHYAGNPSDWPRYRPVLETGLREHGINASFGTGDADRPEDIEYLVYAPSGPVNDLSPFRNLVLVQSLWAGVDGILKDPALNCPLARMVDPSMIQGMTEYIAGHVLRHHLGTDRFAKAGPGEWLSGLLPPPASKRRVGILGAGVLGTAAANALVKLGFDVTTWSRTPRSIPHVRCLHGEAGLPETLQASDILVIMLPQTPDTDNLLDVRTLSMLPVGAAVINPSRGWVIDDDALLEKLNSGHLSGATLDVFRVEPLPARHPFWSHPDILITPHVASETHPESAGKVVVENIRRGVSGEPFLHLVDPERGY